MQAIRWALKREGIEFSAIEAVAFYDKPLVKFERILKSHVAHFPKKLSHSLSRACPLGLIPNFALINCSQKSSNTRADMLWRAPQIVMLRVASYASGWDKAAILTVDGVGEWSTTTWGLGEGSKIHMHKEIRFPHSLGLLYSAFTYYLGFKVNPVNTKVMGLAPYGEPKYVDRIKQLIEIREDGSFRLNMKHFCFDYGMRMFSFFEEVMGQPTRPMDDGEPPSIKMLLVLFKKW